MGIYAGRLLVYISFPTVHRLKYRMCVYGNLHVMVSSVQPYSAYQVHLEYEYIELAGIWVWTLFLLNYPAVPALLTNDEEGRPGVNGR